MLFLDIHISCFAEVVMKTYRVAHSNHDISRYQYHWSYYNIYRNCISHLDKDDFANNNYIEKCLITKICKLFP